MKNRNGVLNIIKLCRERGEFFEDLLNSYANQDSMPKNVYEKQKDWKETYED